MKIIKNIIDRKNYFNFLVIGAGRGGTSLLAGLLDAHSQLTVGMERFAFDYLLGDALKKSEDSLQKRVASFNKACRRESRGHKNWGNKITSEQVYALSSAPANRKGDWQSYFHNEVLKDKKIIYILRDGRTCVRSKMKRTGQDYHTALERWKYSVDLYLFLKQNHKNIHLVRMEDLVTEPKEALKGVCTFLDIEYEEKMLRGTENEKMKEDYRQKSFDPSVIDLKDIPEEWANDMKDYREFLIS